VDRVELWRGARPGRSSFPPASGNVGRSQSAKAKHRGWATFARRSNVFDGLGMIDQNGKCVIRSPSMRGGIRLRLENGQCIDVGPQECWGLVESARAFLVANSLVFDPPPARLIRKQNKRFRVLLSSNLEFWKSVEANAWEPDTFTVFDNFISPETCYVDIGAWIGPTVLYGAQLAKRTCAFEPDPMAFRELEANLSLNKDAEWASSVTLHNEAVASSSGHIRIGSRHGGGDSMSSVLFSGGQVHWDVHATSFDEIMDRHQLRGQKLFVKIDIEGGEYELIPRIKTALARYDIELCLSLHPDFLMSSLVKGTANGLIERWLRRIHFCWRHFMVVRSLPFRHCYTMRGEKLNLYLQLCRALLNGDFVREIVVTNRAWETLRTSF
jgi:FkbM family methyltransferase